jgi:hypothetical protein
MNNCEGASLYDMMEINEDIVLSMVEKQLNHCRIKKVSDGECKNPLLKV